MDAERKRELKEKILEKLNQRYEIAAEQCKRVEEEYLELLENEAHKQLDVSKHGTHEAVASMTIRQVLEMEREGKV